MDMTSTLGEDIYAWSGHLRMESDQHRLNTWMVCSRCSLQLPPCFAEAEVILLIAYYNLKGGGGGVDDGWGRGGSSNDRVLASTVIATQV